VRRKVRRVIDSVYVRRLAAEIEGDQLPRHVGILVDGNRRWARSAGFDDPSDGHRIGGARIETFLRWCDEIGIGRVTIFLLSDDNLSRPAGELDALLQIIVDVVGGLARQGNPWELNLIGALDLLPAPTATQLKEYAAQTQGRREGTRINIAVGYGGQREIADAVRSAIGELLSRGCTMDEIADSFDAQLISEHTYTASQPNIDLIIRTSGEQRLSGFMLWESAYAEMYFCECNWPDFRKIDFLRALRSYTRRHRRFGR